MIALVCLEGLGPDSCYPDSFMKKLCAKWPDQKVAGYIFNGNAGLGKTIQQKAADGEAMALAYLAQPDVDQIVLAGYSQGGAAAILVAHSLQRQGYDVALLALVDAVSKDPGGCGIGFDPPIPSNVKGRVHAYRNATTNSRPLWGNCGLTGVVDKREFWITHGGAAGTFYLTNPAGPPNPNDLVSEVGLLGESHVTNVNQYYEWNSGLALWDYYWGKIQTYLRAMHSTPAKPKNQGSQPGAGNGNGGNSGGGSNGGGSNGGGNGQAQMHIVKSGESLSLISKQYWGDILLWPALYDANKKTVGPNPNLIQVNMKLTVPSIKGYSDAQLNAIRQRGRSC